MRQVRGHDGFASPRMIAGQVVNKCPLMYAGVEDVELIRAFPMFENGILPNPGGWLDQPARFIEAMNIIKNQLDLMAEERRQEEGKNGRN